MHYYKAYGMTFSSSFEIREFIPIPEQETDISISVGKTPKELANPSSLGLLWRQEDDKFLLDVEDVARYLVISDKQVLVDIYPNCKAEDMRRFLLGSVLGVILHQRQTVILRASAVSTKSGAVIFLGFSGAGKTTFLYSNLRSGGKMLSDEKTAIFLDRDGSLNVSAGYPEIALNADIVHKFKVEVEEKRVNPEIGKYYYRTEAFDTVSIPLKAIYLLENHNNEELKIEKISDNNAKFNLLNSFIYLNPYPFNPLQKINYFKVFTEIAKNFPITKIGYSLKVGQYMEVEKRILEDLSV